MKTDAFEDELRQALDDRAGEVPAAAVDRLRQRNYRPRGHSGVTLAGAGLAIAALAASGGAYLAGGTAGSGHAAATGAVVRLDGYTFTLPPGFKTGPPECTSLEFADPVKWDKRFEAGAAAHGGCVQVVLIPSQFKPPPGSMPIQIGRYHGYLLAQPRIHEFDLFTNISSPGKHRWLMVMGRNLSETQVVEMVDRALGQKICPPGRGEEVKGKSCP